MPFANHTAYAYFPRHGKWVEPTSQPANLKQYKTNGNDKLQRPR